MAMTYQQQYVLDGAVARDAIVNLTARHNRCFSEGDRNGWIATFRHAGARFTCDGAKLSTAATPGWSPSTTRSPSTGSTQHSDAWRCCSPPAMAVQRCAPPEATAIS